MGSAIPVGESSLFLACTHHRERSSSNHLLTLLQAKENWLEDWLNRCNDCSDGDLRCPGNFQPVVEPCRRPRQGGLLQNGSKGRPAESDPVAVPGFDEVASKISLPAS